MAEESHAADTEGTGMPEPATDSEAPQPPMNRAQRRAQAAGKKGNTSGFGHQSFGGGGMANRGSRPAGPAPRQSRASGRGK